MLGGTDAFNHKSWVFDRVNNVTPKSYKSDSSCERLYWVDQNGKKQRLRLKIDDACDFVGVYGKGRSGWPLESHHNPATSEEYSQQTAS